MKKAFLPTFYFIIFSLATPIITAVANNKFVLITSLYNEDNNQRIQEYIYCLNNNMHNPSIDTIHIVYDTSKDTHNTMLLNYLKKYPFIKISYIKGRPTFSFLFDLANRIYKTRKILISNADIHFDDSLKLLDNYNLTDKLLSLHRWEVLAPNKIIPIFLQTHGPYGSDTWIFSSPIKKFGDLNFGLGTPYCDWKITYQAYKSKLTVLNPCIDIKCYHIHASGIRHYIVGPTTDNLAWVRPSTLHDHIGNLVIMQEKK